jgi:competence protein ComEC
MRFPKVAQSDTVSLPLFVRIEKKLLSIKYIFSEKLSRVIYEPAATLAAGELLGEKRLLSKELDAQLKIAGVSHIVVLSGYNITIVSESIMRALSFLPRMYASYAALFGIFIFVAGAGFSASVLRAALMASILLLSRKEGAEYSARRALILVAVVMVLFKPSLLLYDASFQLSFLATSGILWGQKYFEKKCSRITNRFTLRETLATTLSAQVAVFPLLIHLSGGVQLYSIVANMLILPVVPAAMFTAFVTILAGFFSYHLSFMFGICTAIILSYQIIVVSTIAALPWAHIPLPHIL